MMKLRKFAEAMLGPLRRGFGRNRVSEITIAGHTVALDPRWKHERAYLDYFRQGKINGPLGMDVWAISHFVKPGGVVLDAGANIGIISLLAEKAGASEVHSFEPDPRLIGRLEKHCLGKTITVHPTALGQEPGLLKLCISSSHNQGSTLSRTLVAKFPSVFRSSENIDVTVETIDGVFGSKHFDFFKIDVEGSECETLQGAGSMLTSDPPPIIYLEAYSEFIDGIHDFLKKFYHHTYRIVCDRSGRCRLFELNSDIAQLERDGLYADPPSYIYSLNAQEKLAEDWTQPASSGGST